jgi:hypothetical protein
MFKAVLKIVVMLMLSIMSFSVFPNEIYKSIDKDGNITFSSIAPADAKVIQTITVKKLIKRISVINGASEQNEKIKAITKRMTESRVQRNKKRQEQTKNYKEEISLIKNQRLEGLKKLQDENSKLNSTKTESEQLKESVRKLLEQ